MSKGQSPTIPEPERKTWIAPENRKPYGDLTAAYSVAAAVPFSILLYFLIKSYFSGDEGDGILFIFVFTLPVTVGLSLVGFGFGLFSVVMKHGKCAAGWIGLVVNSAYALLFAATVSWFLIASRMP